MYEDLDAAVQTTENLLQIFLIHVCVYIYIYIFFFLNIFYISKMQENAFIIISR